MGSTPKAQVTEFRMSLHMGVCWGPCDSVNRLYYGEELFWEGEAVPEVQHSIDVYLPNFQGGALKEGGLDGVVWIMPGDATQVPPRPVEVQMGFSAVDTCPGFRGALTLFFQGAVPHQDGYTIESTTFPELRPEGARNLDWDFGDSNSNAAHPATTTGFAWAHNNPYLKPLWCQVTRCSRTLEDTQWSEIINVDAFGSNSAAVALKDANPAHMIYECFTNTDWGAGEPSSSMDVESFLAAAETLFGEDFGLSMLWNQQVVVEEFIKDVLTHIQAVTFIHPRTGLWTLKLLRDDYDEATLPVFDETNSTLAKVERRLLGETINEVQVKWTNPSNEKEESVILQDLAGVISQGTVVSTTRPYPGIRNVILATDVAARDLRSASAPLASAHLEVDRSGWELVPGAVIKVTSDEHCFSEVVFRVVEVDYGKATDPKIKCAIVEDIFSFDPGQYFVAPSSQWVDDREAPEPADYTKVLAVPMFFMASEEIDTSEFEDPDTVIGVLAATEQTDANTYRLARSGIDLSGAEVFVDLEGERPMLGRGVLTTALDAEPVSSTAGFGLTVGMSFAANGFAVIGGAEDEQEIVFLTVDDDVLRGVLDTTPKAWPAGTEVFYFQVDTPWIDEAVQAAGSSLIYKVRPISSLGTLSIADAPDINYVAVSRPLLPNRPADVRVNGVGFGLSATSDPVDVRDDSNSIGAVVVTWARRNRLLETEFVLSWADADVSPEVGQTTNVRVYNMAGDLLSEYTGIAGTTHTLVEADFDGYPTVAVVVTSTRDGLESLQGHRIDVIVDNAGFGFGFGFNFGGGS